MKILIVEDEKILNNTINKSLKDAGYEVESAFDGFDAMEMIEIESYDLIVLDLNLPNMDGMEILKNLRKEDVETKVLILSARSQIQDKVEGLDAGANDFLQKPFHLDELKARVRSLTRRNFIQNNTELSFDKIKFDSKNRTIFIDEKELKLTRKESGILEYLLLNQGRPVSQEELIDHVWDSSVDLLSNSIRVHISALRKKLK
ncbi:MAG: response regulator transcription factor, partial [Anaerococcus vaginalis]|nr:response regulator transcription factor [Anaerococcus vaginalis]